MTPLRERMIHDMTLRGFLLHVLPRGFTRLRHYGVLANRGRVRKLALCRTLLDQPAPEPREPETAQAMMLRLTGIDITLCRHCGVGTLSQVLVPAPQSLAAMPVSRAPPTTMTSYQRRPRDGSGAAYAVPRQPIRRCRFAAGKRSDTTHRCLRRSRPVRYPPSPPQSASPER